jgi:hypothetical protein
MHHGYVGDRPGQRTGIDVIAEGIARGFLERMRALAEAAER